MRYASNAATFQDWNMVIRAINDMEDFVLVLQKDTREQGWTGESGGGEGTAEESRPVCSVTDDLVSWRNAVRPGPADCRDR